MWWWNDYGPAPWLHFGPFIMIILMAACGLMMYFMMRGHRGGSHGDSAALILRERLARGEINNAEYEELRRVLET